MDPYSQAPSEVVIFEGYLHKMPPLDKLQLVVKWKRRYFVLSCTDPVNPSSAELTYYNDQEKRHKKGSIDLTTITNVNPIHKSSKEHIFSLEAPGRSYLLKAANPRAKILWVAKLLESCSKDHLTYHVTMPAQPMCSYFEGILKLSAPVQVTIISPANGAQILAIPFDRIRRFGCEVIADFDLVWFETCGCKGFPEQFYYFSVPSGIEVAHIIVQEIKRNIELRIRSFLIQEEGDKERCQTTYISRSHYGCGEYPAGTRQGIIQTGLVSIAASPGRTEGSRQLSMISRMRRTSDFSGMPTPGYNDQRRQSTEKRRNTLADLQGGTPTQLAPSPSPRGTPSPTHSPGSSGQRMTLSQFGKRPPSSYANSRIGNGLSNSAGKGEFDSGVQLGAFDPSRHSAPSYYTVSDLPKDKTTTLKDMPKRMSLDEAGKKSRLHRQKQTGSMMPSSRGDKRRVSDTRRDSANGSMGDLLEGGPSILEPDSQYNHLEPGSQYNHLEPDSQYNHLEPDSPYNHLSPVVSATAYSSKSLPGRSKKSTGYDLNSSFGGMSLQSVDRSRKQSKT